MARGSWQRILGGIIAALPLIAAPLAPTAAQPATPTSNAPATKPAKPRSTTVTTAHSASHKVAVRLATPPRHPAGKVAAAKHHELTRKPAEEARIKEARAKSLATLEKKRAAASFAAAKRGPPDHASSAEHSVAMATFEAARSSPRTAPPIAITKAQAPALHPPATQMAIPATQLAPSQQAPSPATKPAAAPVLAALASAAAREPAAATANAIPVVNHQTATAFVGSFLKEAFRLAKQNGATSLQRRAALAELFASNMDVKRIAGYTTSDQLTQKAPDIQQRFRTILVSYLVETYYPQLELAADPSVRVDTAAAEPLGDGTAVVWTTFTKDGWGSQSVQWHLAPENGSYRIVDIFTTGASLVQMERDTFQSVMRNGGFNELMAKLDARTKELASAATE